MGTRCEAEVILLREQKAGCQVMKNITGLTSARLRDIEEELIEALES
jgi:hypothetical protein